VQHRLFFLGYFGCGVTDQIRQREKAQNRCRRRAPLEELPGWVDAGATILKDIVNRRQLKAAPVD
jgi:hypothetical protein